MKYFSIEELTKSETADRLKIKNQPNEEQKLNLEKLIEVLDDIREAWGSAILVTSGFRCTELNKAVGGVSNSIHKIGFAADLFPSNLKYKEFVEFFKVWAKTHQFHQIIEEHSGSSKWVHFSLYGNQGQQDRKVFKIVL